MCDAFLRGALMRLIAVTLLLAVPVGYLAGGRLSGIGALRIRWWGLALGGVALQFLPVGGAPGNAALLGSFVLLIVFMVTNVRTPGFAIIGVGLLLNFLVIGVNIAAGNQGMPVTRNALVGSGQQSSLQELRHDGGAKHYLAGNGDPLVFLGDAIPIGSPLNRAISVGDIFIYGGGAWFVIAGMRRSRRRGAPDPDSSDPESGPDPGPGHSPGPASDPAPGVRSESEPPAAVHAPP